MSVTFEDAELAATALVHGCHDNDNLRSLSESILILYFLEITERAAAVRSAQNIVNEQ